jgi:hypothetical protein
MNKPNLKLSLDTSEFEKAIDDLIQTSEAAGINTNTGFWNLLKMPPITCAIVALLMLILSGLIAIWYGIGAGLLISVWPNFYFGMMAKELETRRNEEARQSRIIRQLMKTNYQEEIHENK